MKKILSIVICIFVFFSTSTAYDINLTRESSDEEAPVFCDTDVRARVENDTLFISTQTQFLIEFTIKGKSVALYDSDNAAINISSYPRGTVFNIITSQNVFSGRLE